VARDGSRGHGARDRSGAVTGTGDESYHHEASGDSVVTPELPCVRSQKPRDTGVCTHLAFSL
jgi:hypothetical protein